MTRSICLAVLGLVLSLLQAGAQSPKPLTKEDLIKSLQANGASSSNVDVDEIKKGLRNVIAVEPGNPSAPTTAATPVSPSIKTLAERPAINIEIFFDYNSSVIKPDSIASLTVLGQALQDSRLSTGRFLIAGHTDGAGSREYNLKLSQERADAIRRFLIAAFPIESARLATVGFGKEQLRDTANPEAAINRRVQIVNIGN